MKRSLFTAVALTLVLYIGAYFWLSQRSQPGLTYQAAALEQVHVASGQTLTVEVADVHKQYIADPGSHLIIHRPIANQNTTELAHVVAMGGSTVEASGTNLYVAAQPGSTVTVRDGVIIDAEGAKLTIYGDGVRSKSIAGTVVHNHGTGDAYVEKGAVGYTDGKGRTIAGDGSLVYAVSPENCDACTQVIAEPGSTTHVYEGAEAFATKLGGATMYVHKGGEGHCNRHCIAYVYPGAEKKFGPTCEVHELTDDTPPPTP